MLGYTDDNTRSILEAQNSNTNANLTTCQHECQVLILKQSGYQFQSEETENTSSMVDDVYRSCAFTIDQMILVLFTIVITVHLCYVDEKLLSC